jgi:hypothetical protein
VRAGIAWEEREACNWAKQHLQGLLGVDRSLRNPFSFEVVVYSPA